MNGQRITLQRLHQEIQNALNAPDVRKKLIDMNVEPQPSSLQQAAELLGSETKRWGEVIQRADPHIGLLHRGTEKLAENRTYLQSVPYMDRLDYVSMMANEHAYVMAIEKMLDLEGKLPLRIEYIRVLVAELNRIASHFVAKWRFCFVFLSLFSAKTNIVSEFAGMVVKNALNGKNP